MFNGRAIKAFTPPPALVLNGRWKILFFRSSKKPFSMTDPLSIPPFLRLPLYTSTRIFIEKRTNTYFRFVGLACNSISNSLKETMKEINQKQLSEILKNFKYIYMKNFMIWKILAKILFKHYMITFFHIRLNITKHQQL